MSIKIYPISMFFDSGSFRVTSPLNTNNPLMVINGMKQLVSTASPNKMFPKIAPNRPATYCTPRADDL